MATLVILRQESEYMVDGHPDTVRISDERLRQEWGWPSIHGLSTGRKRKLYSWLKDWLNDPERPGVYAFRLSRNAKSEKHHCIKVYISDPQTRFEFKMRWC